MRMIFAIFLCRIANFMSKLITRKEGSVIGGYWALKVYPNIIKKIKLPQTIIGVTGSSGKSSTTELLAHVLKDCNKSVIYNKSGSNTVNAITSLILSNTNYKGIVHKDVLLMELDERHMKEVFNYFSPNYLIITNITRDQPPRNAHPEFIYDEIDKVINDKVHLILNADDPLVNKFGYFHKNKVTYFAMDENGYSKKNYLNNIDAAYCPICSTKLNYSFYHYGHLGNYSCSNCNFKRDHIDYLAHNIDLKHRIMYINDEKVNLPSTFLYSVYYTTAVYTMVNILNIQIEKILFAINDNAFKPKRLNIYTLNNRKWQMLVSKNENNLSYKQSIDYIVDSPGKKTIILGFENSSRRYKENDISWIWDIDFEVLNNKNIDKILIIGRFKYDMLTRLEYTGINKNKLILVEDIDKIISIINKKTKGTIYSMVCFDIEIILKDILKKEGFYEN
jgi:UDP-N-acetylmuramyl tripeptide synthase